MRITIESLCRTKIPVVVPASLQSLPVSLLSFITVIVIISFLIVIIISIVVIVIIIVF